MSDTIRHKGVIETIDGKHIAVRIMQNTACGGCSLASHCNIVETKDKLIDVYYNEAQRLKTGQTVEVTVTTGMARKAVFWAFGQPLLLLLVTLITALAFHVNEGMAALLALGVLFPYYIAVRLCWSRWINKSISFGLIVPDTLQE